MKATANNTLRQCERCNRVRPFVMATVFAGDGSGKFRFLCASCERIEMWYSQRRLFDVPKPQPFVFQPDPEPEPEPERNEAQMELFGGE
jgi:hypothetical protein